MFHTRTCFFLQHTGKHTFQKLDNISGGFFPFLFRTRAILSVYTFSAFFLFSSFALTFSHICDDFPCSVNGSYVVTPIDYIIMVKVCLVVLLLGLIRNVRVWHGGRTKRKGMGNSQIPYPLWVGWPETTLYWKGNFSLSSDLLYFHIRQMALSTIYTNIWCCVLWPLVVLSFKGEDIHLRNKISNEILKVWAWWTYTRILLYFRLS